jgi:hypothetical protein
MQSIPSDRFMTPAGEGLPRSSDLDVANPPPATDGIPKYDRRIIGLVSIVYGLLVLVMWGPVGSTNGMSFETAFPYMSETMSKLEGFFYRADPQRIHMNFFYHAAYLLGDMLGVKGSFVPYQVVYALLWWARGILVFLILQRLLPRYRFFNYLVGAFVLVHASDGALQWVGQLNQFGYIFWMLLGYYFFVVAYQAPTGFRSVGWHVLAIGFVYLSLWSYESQILILLLVPWFVPLGTRWNPARFLPLAASWYGVIAYYIYVSVSFYINLKGQTYQESVLRTDWSPASIRHPS